MDHDLRDDGNIYSSDENCEVDAEGDLKPSRGEIPIVALDSELSDSDFSIERKIGQGNFSTVYRATDLRDDSSVALKKIRIYEMMDLKARQDCINEIGLLSQLDHPNVIKYLASFTDSNTLTIILEYCGIGDLACVIRKHRVDKVIMPEAKVWHYFKQMAAGLHHMHSRRVMHRDLKPQNIFIHRDGIIKLGDLGLGRFFTSKENIAHSLVGTPYYMSPERLSQEGYDFKSDIWSLGCILYELAALHSPFWAEGLNLYTLSKKIESSQYPPLAEGYSTGIKDLVSKCIDPVPSQRPTASYLMECALSSSAAC